MLLNQRLLEVAAGRLPRLIITMPPRHGKSMLVSQYFPAWYLGVFPERKIIFASYSGSFASDWGRKARNIFKENGPHLFGTNLDRTCATAAEWRLEPGGGMTAAGAGGSITGKGADLLIIDDPIKNSEQAISRRWRDKVWDWFQSTAYTRLEPDGSVVVIQTRWSTDDLAGRLLKNAEQGGESWRLFNLPAIAESDDPLGRSVGEALWPERFSIEHLHRSRAVVGAKWWSAMYQQRPVDLQGGIFRREWIRYWKAAGNSYRLANESVRRDECWRFATVDLAISEHSRADYTVALVWDCTPFGDLVLLDCVRDRFSAPALVAMLRSLVRKWEIPHLGVEKAGFQEAIIQQLRREGVPVRGMHPRGSKVGRALAAAVRFEGGQVYFPSRADWLMELESELLTFPAAAHDDQVDAVSYACLEVSRRYGPRSAIPTEDNSD